MTRRKSVLPKVLSPEAPVGIEPTNRRFAVLLPLGKNQAVEGNAQRRTVANTPNAALAAPVAAPARTLHEFVRSVLTANAVREWDGSLISSIESEG